MMKRILCLISVLALALCVPVLAEKYNAANASNLDGNHASPANWKTNWEQALELDAAPAQSLGRNEAEEAPAYSFADFTWNAGWDDCNQDIDVA